MVEPKETLRQLIEEKKRTAFNSDYVASDAEALGILISQYFEWDGEQIFQTMFNAMEDANFHTFNEQLKNLWKKQEDEKLEISALTKYVLEVSTILLNSGSTEQIHDEVLNLIAKWNRKQREYFAEHWDWN